MIRFSFRISPAFALLLGTLHLIGQTESEQSNLWPARPVPEESDATSLKIINLNLKARGGIANLKAIRNVEFSGTITEGLVDHSITVNLARPRAIHVRKYRYHLGYDNTLVTATDGHKAWQRITQPETKLPHPVGGVEAAQLKFEAMLPFLFSDMSELGGVYSYKGEKEIAGKKAYVLHGWLPMGIQIEVYFDSKSFQILNYRHPYRIGPSKVLVDRMPTGLASSGKVWWENGYTLQHKGKFFQKVVYDKVRTNVDLDPDLFTMPKIKEFWLKPKN